MSHHQDNIQQSGLGLDFIGPAQPSLTQCLTNKRQSQLFQLGNYDPASSAQLSSAHQLAETLSSGETAERFQDMLVSSIKMTASVMMTSSGTS
jgi:hypothetical protein